MNIELEEISVTKIIVLLNEFPVWEIEEYVANNFNPEQCFPFERLAQWALENGFVKAGE